ncbi:hypothetical protein E0K83_17100 [Gramella sp. BOM4]|nr:hypothetical protein [Christiangramia bathymodioli]
MYFANPTYLWGLLGLLVPLIIHLWSNKESRVIKVGSIKMFEEGVSRNSRNFRLNELWLLLLRMLAISMLVLIMAELRWEKDQPSEEIVYYFEENLLDSPRILGMADSLSEGNPVYLFKEGFPEFENEDVMAEKTAIPDYWKLVKNLENEAYDSAVVFSAGYLKGINGKRPGISKNINWIILDQDESKRKALARRNIGDSLQIIYGISNSQSLYYEKEQVALSENNRNEFDSIPEFWTEPYRIEIFSEDSLQEQVKFFRAAVNAIQNYTGRQIEFDSISKNEAELEADLLIWLSSSEVPDFKNRVLQFQENEFAESLITQGKYENRFLLTRKISSELILDYRFTEELLELIIPSEEIVNLSREIDKRKVSEDFIETGQVEKTRQKLRINYLDLSRYLWPLLFVFLIGERILAKIRRQ